MTDALINLRVPAALKARWVRESRAAGMRLTDWIVQRMEAPMQKITTIAIPAGLEFSALKLARDGSGDVSLDTAVVARIEKASGLPEGFFMTQPEGTLGELIVRWYGMHRAAGGAPDPVAEDLISEARAEDERGGGFSHQPGRA